MFNLTLKAHARQQLYQFHPKRLLCPQTQFSLLGMGPIVAARRNTESHNSKLGRSARSILHE